MHGSASRRSGQGNSLAGPGFHRLARDRAGALVLPPCFPLSSSPPSSAASSPLSPAAFLFFVDLAFFFTLQAHSRKAVGG